MDNLDDDNDNEFEKLHSSFETTQRSQVNENTVFIKGITDVSKPEIENFFKPCHPIVSMILKRSHALVELKNPKMRDLALKLSGGVLKGKKVVVLPKMVEKKVHKGINKT